MKNIVLIRYPHGWFPGGIRTDEFVPPITTSSWENNNFILEIDEEDECVRRVEDERQ